MANLYLCWLGKVIQSANSLECSIFSRSEQVVVRSCAIFRRDGSDDAAFAIFGGESKVRRDVQVCIFQG